MDLKFTVVLNQKCGSPFYKDYFCLPEVFHRASIWHSVMLFTHTRGTGARVMK